MNILDDMIKEYEKRFSDLESYTDEEIMGVIRELQKDKELWGKIPEGNRHYLETALQRFKEDPSNAHKYVRGAIPHLIRAGPHQYGHIASKLKEKVPPIKTSKEEVYRRVFLAEVKLDDLSNEELLDLARYVNSDPSLSSLSFYRGSKGAVDAIIGKYERLLKKDPKQSAEYIKEKSTSLKNILGKTFIPNLLGYIAREYKKRKGP